MYDKLSALVSPKKTITSTESGTALDMSKGTRLDGMVARVMYSAAGTASGTGTLTFSLEHSDEASSGFTTLVSGEPLSLTSTAKAGSQMLKFYTDKRYVRLTTTISGGTDPTVDVEAEVTFSKP